MKRMFKCDFCGLSFNSEEECDSHEDMHKKLNEMKAKHTNKFNEGDVIQVDGREGLYTVYCATPVQSPDGKFYWKYLCEDFGDQFYATENYASLVLTKEELEDVVKKLNEELKKYGKSVYLEIDTIDGVPSFSIKKL